MPRIRYLWAGRTWAGRTAWLVHIVFFALSAAGTLNLAAEEWKLTATRAGGDGEALALRAAVRSNPRDSGAWIALGLEAERARDRSTAAAYFAEAERVDRRYLPAWSAANFYFRQSDPVRFWSAAARASAMLYDDARPLIELADRMEPDPAIAIKRLHAGPSMERAYLDYLTGKQRWEAAGTVARKILARGDRADFARLQDFAGRLSGAGKTEAAEMLRRQIRSRPIRSLL